MLMFSIYDSKAEAYNNPFYARNEATARRMFGAAAMDPNTDLHKFGGDFTLFMVGEFDEDTGLLHRPPLGGGAFINCGTALQAVQLVQYTEIEEADLSEVKAADVKTLRDALRDENGNS